MNYYKTKLIGIAFGASSVLIPPALYKASECYISLYHKSAEALSTLRHSALMKIGLTETSNPTIPELITSAAHEYNLPPKLLSSLIAAESSHSSEAFSPKGAIGLSQIMPANAKRCGLTGPSKLWDDKTNVFCGAQILSEELVSNKNNLRKALEAYNGGTKCVNRCPESIRYASNIMLSFAQKSL